MGRLRTTAVVVLLTVALMLVGLPVRWVAAAGVAGVALVLLTDGRRR